MKKSLFVVLSLLLVFVLSSCSATNKESVIKIFEKNEEIITKAIETGDFSKAKKIRGIEDIDIGDGYIAFECGAKGFASNTSYYGFAYSPSGNFNSSIGGNISKKECIPSGEGFLWKESDGDNEFYFEEIGDGFIYYELHF